MKQVRVTAVNGRKIQAAGKWLTTIGNRAVAVGDLVWTDGKCVYGHSPTSGGAPTIIAGKPEEVPLLIGNYASIEGKRYGCYSTKKGVQVFGYGQSHDGMINNKSRFALVDNDEDQGRYWRDVNMDSDGTIYRISRGYADFFSGSGMVNERNVEMFVGSGCVSSFGIQSYLEDVKADANARIGSDNDGDCASTAINGKIFSADDYWLIVHAVGTAHKYVPYPPFLSDSSYTCYIVRRWLVTPASSTLIYEESVYCYGWPLIYWEWDCEIDYSPPQIREVRLPLGDGYYYILGGNPNPCITTRPHSGVGVFFLEYGGYTAYVYSPEDRLIAILSKETTGRWISATNNISLCKLSKDKYLISVKDYGLYMAQDGVLTSLDTSPHNWRLCPLKNIKSWKNQVEVQEG